VEDRAHALAVAYGRIRVWIRKVDNESLVRLVNRITFNYDDDRLARLARIKGQGGSRNGNIIRSGGGRAISRRVIDGNRLIGRIGEADRKGMIGFIRNITRVVGIALILRRRVV